MVPSAKKTNIKERLQALKNKKAKSKEDPKSTWLIWIMMFMETLILNNQMTDWSLNFLNSKIADSFLISFVKAL